MGLQVHYWVAKIPGGMVSTLSLVLPFVRGACLAPAHQVLCSEDLTGTRTWSFRNVTGSQCLPTAENSVEEMPMPVNVPQDSVHQGNCSVMSLIPKSMRSEGRGTLGWHSVETETSSNWAGRAMMMASRKGWKFTVEYLAASTSVISYRKGSCAS